MINIFKNLKNYAGFVVMIVALLLVQAFCDLSLPDYTSDIVNVGISQYGIENGILDVIDEDSMNALCMFVSEEDEKFILDSYMKYDNTKELPSSVKKEYKNYEDYNIIYKLNTDNEEDIKRLKDILYPVEMISYMLTADSEEAVAMQEQIKTQITATMPGAENMALMDIFSNMPREARLQMIEQMQGNMDEELASTMYESTAIIYAKSIYEKLGADIENIQIRYMMAKGGMMLLFAIVAMISTIVVGYLASKVAAGVGRDLRNKVFTKVVSFSNTEMDKFSTASLITRTTNDIQQVQFVTVMLLRMVLYAPILGIGGVLKVLQNDTSMAWIILVAVLAIIVLVVVLFSFVMPKFKIMQTLVDRVNLVAREILTGIPVIRAFSTEEHEKERFDEANIRLTKTQLFTNRAMNIMMPAMMFIMNGVMVMIIWFGSKGVDAGSLQVGDMMAFMTYTMQIVMSFLMITMISIMLPRAGVAANRIDEVIKSDIVIKDKDITKSLTGDSTIEFNNVSFRYPNADEDVLSNITFTAKPGETTAFIGSTGSGKSTLVNLIPRFYDVSEGSITINGTDIRDISQEELRRNIGYVPQKGVLFSGTIESNIKFGKDDATEAEVVEAARIAQAEEFIETKPYRYQDEIAQGGTNVSGGQKQRLSIARAIAKNPKIYIFDDSFSALDFKTDVTLRKALSAKTKDSTVLIVAQRISTILHADKIIVLDEGKICGMGTHEELIKNNEVYRQIAASQLSASDMDTINA